jgi:acetyl-CoA carboxylase carboxyltransferase component
VKRGDEVEARLAQVRAGGDSKYHEKAREARKLFCRERLRLLLDADSFVEDGVFANSLAGDLPADGVVTGSGRVKGRPVCVMANDSTVKAGSWGARTVEKILRIQERAGRLRVPLLYLVDSAGARITDQIQMFPGRRGAGRIFHKPVPALGHDPAGVPAVRPVRRRRRLHPGLLRRGVHGRGQRQHVPRLAAHGRDGDRPEDDARGDGRRSYLSYLPLHNDGELPEREAGVPAEDCADLESVIPAEENKPFDMRQVIERVVDAGSFFEIKKLYAGELLTGFARIEGRSVGVVANQPKVKGGVLFVNSADKAARFIGLCDAFGVPLLFLADVPGFMVGKQVEREGIIRAGAKMIMAVSEATVPRLSVIVRKAYGAGLYAMSGPGFEPEATIALPSAMIAVMGPAAAVNAVFYNKLQGLSGEERAAEEARLRAEYRDDVDIERLASELVIDAIVPPAALRDEIAARLRAARGRRDTPPDKRHSVTPS